MAKIDVIMPQMGESIAEGTLSRWIKQVGDAVKRDEPIFEISTDKVDAEIPAPAAGVLAEILVKEGETVAVQTVVAQAYGAYRPEGYSERALFVVDKEGKIVYKDIHEISDQPDNEVIFDVLRKLD